MAIEPKRGCGYRKVGGLYLRGGMVTIPCDRLPYQLTSCPCCGEGTKFSRTPKEINPLQLFGIHQNCEDQLKPCWMCDPEDKLAYLICIGEQFYKSPDDFMSESREQGISRRIKTIPKNLILGETVVYLAHNKCSFLESPPQGMELVSPDSTLNETITVDIHDTEDSIAEKIKELKTKAFKFIESMPKQIKAFGIFSAFIPQKIEKLYWQSTIDGMSPEELGNLKKRGITPVGIPDGDKDHA